MEIGYRTEKTRLFNETEYDRPKLAALFPANPILNQVQKKNSCRVGRQNPLPHY